MQKYNYTEFQKLGLKARRGYLEKIVDTLEDFRLIDVGTKSSVPLFEHTKSEIEFSFIPGGIFTMGVTESEEKAARVIADPPPLTISEMRPTKKRSVSSFLISTKPVLVGTVKRLFDESCLSDYDIKNSDEDFPAYVRRDAALYMS
jgi:formylglycine-generating enzyme required for sulfatase activity